MCLPFLCYQGYTPRTRCFLVLLSQASGDTVLVTYFLQFCYIQRNLSISVCLLQHCTYVAGIMSQCGWLGRGSEGLLWQREVNQHSVHAAFHYKLCWGQQRGSNLRPQADVSWVCTEENPHGPAAAWSDNDTANSSHRRDYLTFLGVSNVTYFL